MSLTPRLSWNLLHRQMQNVAVVCVDCQREIKQMDGWTILVLLSLLGLDFKYNRLRILRGVVSLVGNVIVRLESRRPRPRDENVIDMDPTDLDP